MSSLAVSNQRSQIVQIAPSYSQDQLDTIKNVICKGANNEELALFMAITQRTGLDPFARQIFAVKRKQNVDGQWKEVLSVQVSIDGFRLIAARTGKYRGQTGPYWCGKDGVWRDVWLEDEPPLAAKVGVRHADFVDPLYRVAKFWSYAQTTKEDKLNQIWKKFPELMIAKCAESLALRSAFPQELSGLYTPDEMGNVDTEYPQASPIQQPMKTMQVEVAEAMMQEDPMLKQQWEQRILESIKAKGWSTADKPTMNWIVIQMKTRYGGKDTRAKLTIAECQDFVNFIDNFQSPAQQEQQPQQEPDPDDIPFN